MPRRLVLQVCVFPLRMTLSERGRQRPARSEHEDDAAVAGPTCGARYG